jgi:hypothetical protein
MRGHRLARPYGTRFACHRALIGGAKKYDALIGWRAAIALLGY